MSGVDKAQVLEDLVAHLSERLDQADEAVGLRQQVGEVIEQDEHRVDDVRIRRTLATCTTCSRGRQDAAAHRRDGEGVDDDGDAAIEGKRAEDTFEFNGTMLTLDDVS